MPELHRITDPTLDLHGGENVSPDPQATQDTASLGEGEVKEFLGHTAALDKSRRFGATNPTEMLIAGGVVFTVSFLLGSLLAWAERLRREEDRNNGHWRS